MPRASRPAKDEGASLADLLEPVGGEPTHVLGPTPRPSLSRAASPAVGARDADGETATRIHRPSSSAPSHAVIDDDSATSVRSGETFPSRGSLVSQESPALFGTELPAGTIIGRYMIVEPLGSGGLGDVYTAYDPELDRRLAIKLLRPTPGGTGDSGAGSGSDRLQREAKAMARLAHPNVVAVHDVGRAGDDVFIAMERVEGLTLSQWIRAETRPWTVIRDVFLGAGRGLAAAHDAGIVHRDFKPANVIVSADGRPRVLDFGLARAVEVDDRSGLMRLPRTQLPVGPGTSSLDDPITLPGTVMGTPQYMAPEQFEGSEHSGAASDQFSFCVALWFALYGRRPFSGDDVAGIIAAARAGRITEPDRKSVV